MEIADIRKLASLSRIAIPETELEELRADMTSILGYIAQIESVATSGHTPIAGTVHNVMREDALPHTSRMHTEALLADAPGQEAGYVKVKQIITGGESFDA